MYDEIPPLIIDNGSGSIKAGFSGSDAPRFVFPSVVARPKSVFLSMDKARSYIGKEAGNCEENLAMRYPVERGLITNWDDMEEIWRYTFDSQLQVDPENHPLLLVEGVWHPTPSRDKMAEIMFETFRVPFLHLAKQYVLAMYGSGRTDGISLTSGDGVTMAIPILDGFPILSAAKTLDIAGKDLTNYLGKLISAKSPASSLSEGGATLPFDALENAKRSLCFVSGDYSAALQRSSSVQHLEKMFEYPNGLTFSLGAERFQCAEPLFQPSLLGISDGLGLPQLVFDSGKQLKIHSQDTVFANIVLSGGNLRFKKLVPRLKDELISIFQSQELRRHYQIGVFFEPDGEDLIWKGASTLTSLETFQPMWASQAEYEETGPAILSQKSL